MYVSTIILAELAARRMLGPGGDPRRGGSVALYSCAVCIVV